MYMKKYPCVYMRGGTSKAVFFHEKDLPEDQSKLWDEICSKGHGNPGCEADRRHGRNRVLHQQDR